MGKKVLILSGSPRKGGNSDLLCDEFMRGALEAGHQVEKIWVASKKIAPCSGCYYCRNHGGECARKDDMAEILQKMIDTDVLVLATPVYFYSIDAQLKTLVDRSLARWREVRGKELYYIVTMAEADLSAADTTLACLHGYADCVAGAVEREPSLAAAFMSRARSWERPLWKRPTVWERRFNKQCPLKGGCVKWNSTGSSIFSPMGAAYPFQTEKIFSRSCAVRGWPRKRPVAATGNAANARFASMAQQCWPARRQFAGI